MDKAEEGEQGICYKEYIGDYFSYNKQRNAEEILVLKKQIGCLKKNSLFHHGPGNTKAVKEGKKEGSSGIRFGTAAVQ